MSTEIYNEIFLYDLQHFSKSYFNIPKWQIIACKEAIELSKHYHKYLELNSNGENLSIALINDNVDMNVRFDFTKQAMRMKLDPTKPETAFFPNSGGVGRAIAYAIDTLYDTGTITETDIKIMRHIADIESGLNKKKNELESVKKLKQIKQAVKHGSYHMHHNTPDIAIHLIANVGYLNNAQVDIVDDGRAIMLTYVFDTKKIELIIRCTNGISQRFYVNMRMYDNDNLITNKILLNDIDRMCDVLTTAIALIRVRRKR